MGNSSSTPILHTYGSSSKIWASMFITILRKFMINDHNSSSVSWFINYILSQVYIIHKIYLHGRTCILPPCPTFKLNLNLSVVVKLSVWWILIFFLIPFIGLWILWFWNSCLYDWFIFLKCKNADQKVYGKYSTICSARRSICIFIVHFMDPWDGSIDFCK